MLNKKSYRRRSRVSPNKRRDFESVSLRQLSSLSLASAVKTLLLVHYP
ncbi:MAG: hypothetical protein ACR2MG_08340 [Pyrinomonadaceae bacterium]